MLAAVFLFFDLELSRKRPPLIAIEMVRIGLGLSKQGASYLLMVLKVKG